MENFCCKLHIPPNINGKYNIKIESSFNPDKCYCGTAEIKQTYDSLHIISDFGKSKGKSFITKMAKCHDEWYLLYSYTNRVTDFDLRKSGAHDHSGFSELTVKNEKSSLSLSGEYANCGRETRGNITFIKKI